MTMTSQDFSMRAGDSKEVGVTVTMPVGYTLAGSTVRWWLAPTATTPAARVPLKKISPNGGVTITDQDTFVVSLAPDDTVDLPARTYYHEAEVMLPSGAVETIMIGQVTIEPSLIPPP